MIDSAQPFRSFQALQGSCEEDAALLLPAAFGCFHENQFPGCPCYNLEEEQMIFGGLFVPHLKVGENLNLSAS